ncbi:MAG: PKD domain-containing protein, partial [Bacteroidales bacterium]|nr:PKD domain-containing protein [Bacteroidales bacterium]
EESSVGANDGTITVDVTGGEPPYTYAWDNGGDTHAITGLTAGTYCVTVIENNGCSAAACIEVTTIYEDPFVADFEADITEGCAPLTVQFTDLSEGEITGYTWNFGNGGTSSEENPEYIFESSGTFTIILAITDGENTVTEIKTEYITVYESPEITIDEIIDATGEDIADGSATISVTGGEEPYTILWSNSQTGLSIVDVLPDTYSVVVEDANGCSNTGMVVIGWNVDIDNIESNNISVYPNPVNDYINIVADIDISFIEIMDATGSLVLCQSVDSKSISINLNELSVGNYIIKISDINNVNVFKSLIKY